MCSCFLRNFYRLPNGLYRFGWTTKMVSPVFRHASTTIEQKSCPNKIFDQVNSIIGSKDFGQTFAVIHLHEQQHLIHLADILAVKFPIQADIGETIKLEKCLMVGNSNFTLIGRPVLNRDLVQIEAMIIEKTMTQTYMDMFHIPRKHGFKRYRFKREPLTMLRIQEITVCHPLNTPQQKIN